MASFGQTVRRPPQQNRSSIRIHSWSALQSAYEPAAARSIASGNPVSAPPARRRLRVCWRVLKPGLRPAGAVGDRRQPPRFSHGLVCWVFAGSGRGRVSGPAGTGLPGDAQRFPDGVQHPHVVGTAKAPARTSAAATITCSRCSTRADADAGRAWASESAAATAGRSRIFPQSPRPRRRHWAAGTAASSASTPVGEPAPALHGHLAASASFPGRPRARVKRHHRQRKLGGDLAGGGPGPRAGQRGGEAGCLSRPVPQRSPITGVPGYTGP